MTVKIVPISEDIPHVDILVFGDSGVGKTVFAGSDDRVLFLAIEDKGIVSSARLGSKASKIVVTDYPEFVEAVNWLTDNPEVLDDYDWISVDSAPELQNMIMRHITSVQRQDRINKDQDPDQPQIQDYGKLHILFDKAIRAINDLPVNVLYTATAKKVEDADGNEFLVPDISGKDYGIAMKTVAQMTSYGYLKVEVVERPDPTEDQPNKVKKVKQRVIIWEDTGTIRGKDRTTRLTPKTVLPPRNALKHIRTLIEGEPAKKSRVENIPVQIETKEEASDLIEA